MPQFVPPNWPDLLDFSKSSGSTGGAEDGKSSQAYHEFSSPILNTPDTGFDVHVYHLQTNELQATYAKSLYERIKTEFPELRLGRFHNAPIGPHPIATFQVDIKTPSEFGAIVPWLVLNRGPLSVLVHPNTEETGDAMRDGEMEFLNHTERAIWMGERIPLETTLFYNLATKQLQAKQSSE